MTVPSRSLAVRALVYGFTNVSSTVAIVLANKIVLYRCGFSFPVSLTFLHTVVTWIGMVLLLLGGAYQYKAVARHLCLRLAAAHSACIVLNNVSLHLNTVGFYQTSKIVQTPAVVFIEMYFYNKRISGQAMTSIGALLVGVVLASIYDPQVTSNPVGVAVATINIVTAALNSVWTGSMQREAGVDGNQLLLNMSPWAAVLLAPVVPLFEPLGLTKWSPHSVFGYIINEMDLNAAMWILASAVLGLVVSQSACMFIGCTSGTTYSVVSHLKTLSIVVMGVTMFGDSLSLKKGAGLALAMSGLVWYSFEAMRSVPPPTPQTDKEKAAAGEQVALLVRPVRISSDTEAAAAADYDQAPDQEVADVDKVKPGV